MNLVSRLLDHRNKRPKKIAVQYFKRGHLYSLNWEQTHDRINQIFQSLNAIGVGEGDRVCLYSDTCKEWGFIDLATMALRAVTVPIYHSMHAEEVSYILKEIQPKVLFIQNEGLLRKIQSTPEYASIENVIIINEFETKSDGFQFLKEFISQPRNSVDLADAAAKVKLDHLATIIYTSGTLGNPKGVRLNHEQVMSTVSDAFPLLGVTDQDCTLTFLPFSHVLGRIELWGHYFCGYTISYAESIDRIKNNLLVIKPTVLVAVPRIFEKIYFGINAQVEISRLKKGIFDQAVKIGRQSTELRTKKEAPSLFQALKAQVAHQLVFSNIRSKFGGHLRFAISGGAPLEPQIADFFSACGIPVLEGYGLTETTGPIFVNTLFEHKNGTVGKAIGDVELRFDTDGEILVRSKKIMKSYYKNAEDSKAVFTEDGFFRTGDIGKIDSDGFLQITDRKKNLIKTTGGKFVAPQKIQNLFSTQSLISHVHIHGDKRKYVVALITLDKAEVKKLFGGKPSTEGDYSIVINSQQVQETVRKIVAKINTQLSSFETVKRYKILDHDFTIEGGQLTPSLKMKRKKIDEMYAKDIKSLYT